MKTAPLLKAEAPSLDLMLVKAHVSAFTRKDGTFAAELDGKRAAARQDAPAAGGKKPLAKSTATATAIPLLFVRPTASR